MPGRKGLVVRNQLLNTGPFQIEVPSTRCDSNVKKLEGCDALRVAKWKMTA